jgi:hypothetical protein
MRISNKVVWREIDGEIFIIDAENQKISELNETASAVFLLISKNKDINQIRDAILSEYDVSATTAQNDINEILEKLKEIGIVYE